MTFTATATAIHLHPHHQRRIQPVEVNKSMSPGSCKGPVHTPHPQSRHLHPSFPHNNGHIDASSATPLKALRMSDIGEVTPHSSAIAEFLTENKMLMQQPQPQLRMLHSASAPDVRKSIIDSVQRTPEVSTHASTPSLPSSTATTRSATPTPVRVLSVSISSTPSFGSLSSSSATSLFNTSTTTPIDTLSAARRRALIAALKKQRRMLADGQAAPVATSSRYHVHVAAVTGTPQFEWPDSTSPDSSNSSPFLLSPALILSSARRGLCHVWVATRRICSSVHRKVKSVMNC